MNSNIKIYDTPEILAESFAEEFFLKVKSLSEKSDRVSIALSGGTTPKLFFKVLAEKYKDKIDWQKTHFYWVDERCVPPDDPESNFGMTNEFLFSHISIPSQNIQRIRGEEDPEIESVRYSHVILNNVKSDNDLPQFDITLLGIGEDGHTASIFPNQMKLLDSPEICEAAVHPVSSQKRITLTGKVINNSSYIAFLVSRESKAKIISQIINKSPESGKYPAAYIHMSNGNLQWFLDKSSASLL